MLKLNPNPQFTTDVLLSEPGNPEPVPVRMTFRYKNRKELAALVEKVDEKGVEKALQKIIAGWEGVDADCTPENIALLVQNYPVSSGEIFNAYYHELFTSRVKN